ncbi:cytochrome P450 [Calocera cornea HHB12733]|uniref:Cytochrome P450 n=1 Tax=Calocera cornea HHB12733 TaxID=1353952 RepID=A0A165J7D1_9BASI|nr:cytochrome P450 [Calocera cornea HHB12733]
MLTAACAGYVLLCTWRFCKRFRTPLRRFPGPPADSLLWGNSPKMIKADPIERTWVEQYGITYTTPVMLGRYRLNTIDPRAVAHILSHVENYPKPNHTKAMLRSVVGDGLLVVEDDAHRRQKRIMYPCFSPSQIREVTPIFFETANQVSVWRSNASISPKGLEIDIYTLAARAALDIIGLAGFGYRFNALEDQSNELFNAWHDVMQALTVSPLLGLLCQRFPWVRFLPLKANTVIRTSVKTMNRIGMDLVRAKKAAIEEETFAYGIMRKTSIVGRDMLTAMIRANMAADVPHTQRMSTEEVIAQILTFLGAGHETSAAGLSWTLLSLAEHPEVQRKLRAELSQVENDSPGMDALDSLPYLDMVMKESLRLHSPVPLTTRTARRDDEIPLSRPVLDKNGKSHNSIRVQAGDSIGVEIRAMNNSKLLWGEDAYVFRPERWSESFVCANEIPGIYAHSLTFIGGERTCIGYRFSIIDMKAILFTLIRSFEFAQAPGKEIGISTMVVARPFVKGEESKGLQQPMIVSRVSKVV